MDTAADNEEQLHQQGLTVDCAQEIVERADPLERGEQPGYAENCERGTAYPGKAADQPAEPAADAAGEPGTTEG